MMPQVNPAAQTIRDFLVRIIRKIPSWRLLNCRRVSFQLIDQLLQNTPVGSMVSPNICAHIAVAAGRSQIDKPQRLRRFWQQQRPVGNYFLTPQTSYRSETVINMLKPWITSEYSILEVGCNVGRNLNHLYMSGYEKLAGIEINHNAVQRLRRAYTQLKSANVDVGPAEEVLGHYRSSSFDVVFTMAVLEHIHPSSRTVFSQIARVARRYVLVIEPSHGRASHRQYPWKIEEEFKSIGLKLIDKRTWDSLWPVQLTQENEWDESFHDFDAWLFEVPDQLSAGTGSNRAASETER
jgi:SAM-dependent methyltransferase